MILASNTPPIASWNNVPADSYQLTAVATDNLSTSTSSSFVTPAQASLYYINAYMKLKNAILDLYGIQLSR